MQTDFHTYWGKNNRIASWLLFCSVLSTAGMLFIWRNFSTQNVPDKSPSLSKSGKSVETALVRIKGRSCHHFPQISCGYTRHTFMEFQANFCVETISLHLKFKYKCWIYMKFTLCSNNCISVASILYKDSLSPRQLPLFLLFSLSLAPPPRTLWTFSIASLILNSCFLSHLQRESNKKPHLFQQHLEAHVMAVNSD